MPPPVSSKSYLFASFSMIFFMDAPEWTPLNFWLSLSISDAIYAATLSSTSLLALSACETVVDLSHSAFCFSFLFCCSSILLCMDMCDFTLRTDFVACDSTPINENSNKYLLYSKTLSFFSSCSSSAASFHSCAIFYFQSWSCLISLTLSLIMEKTCLISKSFMYLS